MTDITRSQVSRLCADIDARVQAFLNLELGTEVGDAVLGPFSADGFAPIADADYDIIRDIRAALQPDS